MAKASVTPDQLVELPFPRNGLYVAKGFDEQPPGTTPLVKNVRTYEPLTMRARGGSREGLSEYIPAQVLGFASKIQHLNYIVDPTEAAITDDWSGQDALPAGQLAPFPGFPGQFVRIGGSGKQPNKNKPSKPSITKVSPKFGRGAGGDTITITGKNLGDVSAIFNFGPSNPATTVSNNGVTAVVTSPSGNGTVDVRVTNSKGTSPITGVDKFGYITPLNLSAFGGQYTSASPINLSTGNVTKGNLLLVAVITSTGNAASRPNNQTVSVSDSLGNSYSQVGTFSRFGSSNGSSVSLWFAIAVSSGSNTVSVTPTSNGGITGIAFGGVEFASQAWVGLDGQSSNSGVSPGGTDGCDIGTVSVGAPIDLIFEGFIADDSNLTTGSVFTFLFKCAPSAGNGKLVLGYLVSSAAVDATGSAGNGFNFAGIGASFH